MGVSSCPLGAMVRGVKQINVLLSPVRLTVIRVYTNTV